TLFFRVFFFSSRRRHTRFSRDWSSDVCSSDLPTDVGDVDKNGCQSHGYVFSGFRLRMDGTVAGTTNVPRVRAVKAAVSGTRGDRDARRTGMRGPHVLKSEARGPHGGRVEAGVGELHVDGVHRPGAG